MAKEIQSFRDLIVWQKAMDLCCQVYEISTLFPDSERFGLTSQLRRACVSVPSNIAEGYGRGRTQDYLRYLDVARGSLYEAHTQLLLAKRLQIADSRQLDACLNLVGDVDRLLNALSRSVRDWDQPGPGK
jgi:four helix bundle protein